MIFILVSLPIASASLSLHNRHSASASAIASESRSDFSCQFSTFQKETVLSRLDLVVCFKVSNNIVYATCYRTGDKIRNTDRAAKIFNNKL